MSDIKGSALYHRAMAFYDANDRNPALQHKVWDGTPWMIDVWTGDSDRTRAIIKWARQHFGDEAWPIHGRSGAWHCGGVTLYGWTWFGFDSAEAMEAFQMEWGGTDQEHDFAPPDGGTNG